MRGRAYIGTSTMAKNCDDTNDDDSFNQCQPLIRLAGETNSHDCFISISNAVQDLLGFWLMTGLEVRDGGALGVKITRGGLIAINGKSLYLSISPPSPLTLALSPPRGEGTCCGGSIAIRETPMVPGFLPGGRDAALYVRPGDLTLHRRVVQFLIFKNLSISEQNRGFRL